MQQANGRQVVEGRLTKRPRTSPSASSLPESVASLLVNYMQPAEDEPTLRLASPDELLAQFDTAGCALPLSAGEKPLEDEKLLAAVELVLKYSARTIHPLFFNQLYHAADPAAVCGEWVVAAANTNSFTYEVAPVFALTERSVLARFAAAIGGRFAETHDGLFVPGSSIGNMYGMVLARHRACPDINTKGAAAAGRLVAFVSAEAHYSYLKNARVMGLGTDNLISVPTDAAGAMDPAALSTAIGKARAEGGVPFFVGATAGTTVIGAFDPLQRIREVCDEEGLWMHVDGAWGGAAVLSPTHRHHLDGCGAADSFACSLHKMLGATLQCAIFLTAHEGALVAANSARAAYLFQPDKLYTELDVGDKTIQCGRKPDSLKIWMMWKRLGDEGMAHRVDHAFALAAHAVERIRAADSGFVLAYEPSCTNVCFWYVPRRLRPLPPIAKLTPQHAVHHVAVKVKAEMQRLGEALIGFQSINGRPNFFRWVFASADDVTTAHVDQVLDRIAALGEELDGEQ